ncbi:hypothetical protein B5S31_g95 [[Candida] boidinii]|nr:hypothetical protein B5S31_g95 [[Candida] boidinii]
MSSIPVTDIDSCPKDLDQIPITPPENELNFTDNNTFSSGSRLGSAANNHLDSTFFIPSDNFDSDFDSNSISNNNSITGNTTLKDSLLKNDNTNTNTTNTRPSLSRKNSIDLNNLSNSSNSFIIRTNSRKDLTNKENLNFTSLSNSGNSITTNNDLIQKSLTNLSDLNNNNNSKDLIVEKTFNFPIEILDNIIKYVYFDNPSDVYSINQNIKSFAKSISPVCSLFYLLSLKYLYKYGNFTRSRTFDHFLRNLLTSKNLLLGNYVEYLDFSEFTSIGLGRTGEMMNDIQMVTSNTILKCLKLTPNLKEFLASESIQSDIDYKILNYLFNDLPLLDTLDFCGCSGPKFSQAFKEMIILNTPDNVTNNINNINSNDNNNNNNNIETIDEESENVNFTINYNSNIKRLSFHDCTDLPTEVFVKIFSRLNNLRRLDLTHTQVTSNLLFNTLSSDIRLSHLSIGKCSQIGTTRDLMNFLLNHSSVNKGSLRYLNLQVNTSNESCFNDRTLSFLLNNLNCPNLNYLNLAGNSVNLQHLKIINSKFKSLNSLIISNSQISINDLIEFFKNCKKLKFIDLTGNRFITRWTIDNYKFLNSCPSLIAIEVDNKVAEELKETTKRIRIESLSTGKISIWKSYDNNGQGRRSWIFKLNKKQMKDELNNKNLNFNNNIIYFDINTGEKIFKKIDFPNFLKYASIKINCSKGLFFNEPNDNFNELEMMEIETNNNNNNSNTEGGNNESRNNSTTSVSTIASSNTTQPPPLNNSMSYNNININLNRLNSTSLLTRAIESRNNQIEDDDDDENGLNADPDNIFPVEFTQRGLYKYYALSK